MRLLSAALGAAALILPFHTLSAQDLNVRPADVRIQARSDGSLDLYIRKKPDLSSILLTETTKDPNGKIDNFAYRAEEYNTVNGDEKRMLDGKFLPATSKLYSLISSTPVPDPQFGRAFHILIPKILEYGYPWSRSGSVSVGEGTFINIRSFTLPYADYRGAFRDNPYEIKITVPPPVVAKTPPPPPPEAPRPEPPPVAQEKPKDVIPAAEDTPAAVVNIIKHVTGESLDLVICLDTTDSMDPYISALKKRLVPMVRETVSRFKQFRVGLVLFKDYWPDDYITRNIPFMSNLDSVARYINSVSVYGGRDIPEAEFEALYAAGTQFDWQAEKRLVILVTDAPPHPYPKGTITFNDVTRVVADKHIELDSIIPPTEFTPTKTHTDLEKVVEELRSRLDSGNAVSVYTADRPAATALSAALGSRSGFRIIASAPGGTTTARVDPAPQGNAVYSGPEIGAAKVVGADYVLLVNSIAYSAEDTVSAMSETDYRLIYVRTEREVARDVVWKVTSSSNATSEFIDGDRVH